MAVSQWKLIRMEVSEVNIFKDADGAKTQISLLDRLWQAECRLERSYSRAQRELQRLQNSRPHSVQQPEDPTPAPAAEATSTATAEAGQASSPAQSAAPSEIRNPTSEIQPGSPIRLNPNPPPCNNTIPPHTEA
jgi:hypothetical protein